MTLVLDTSALSAILLLEPEADQFIEAMENADPVFISSATLFEARVVALHRRGADGVRRLDALISNNAVTLVDFDGAQAQLAFEAYNYFGKGRHPAKLNLIDCVGYALAKSLNAPLLFKGDDFRQTDIKSAF